MSNLIKAIYPKEARPVTRYLSLLGAFFALSLIAFFIAFLAVKFTKPAGNYLAALGNIRNQLSSNSVITTSTFSRTSATSSLNQTSKPPISAQTQTLKPNSLILTPGPKKTAIYPMTTGTVSLPNGAPDLAMQIIDTGIIDDSGNFIHATSTGQGQQTGIVFEVGNAGTSASGAWRFTARLPAMAGNFTSEPQDSLLPGEKIRYTIGFRLLNNQGVNISTIEVDPGRAVTKETNRSNNSALVTIIRNY